MSVEIKLNFKYPHSGYLRRNPTADSSARATKLGLNHPNKLEIELSDPRLAQCEHLPKGFLGCFRDTHGTELAICFPRTPHFLAHRL
jgi:hypothetical protein